MENSAANSIAFGSAPRREAVSQLDRPAVSQTETHTLGFLSVADTGPSSGENSWPQSWQWPNGDAGGRRLFGRRFEPWCVQYGSGSGATAGVYPPGFEPPSEKSESHALPFNRGRIRQNCVSHCLEPSQRKLLTPPTQPPPPQKCYPVLGDRGLRIKKSIGGMVLLGKIMILQGVGHQISCLGVCYANDPKKGGYTTPAPALDLTTSLQGDLKHQNCNAKFTAHRILPHQTTSWQVHAIYGPRVSSTLPASSNKSNKSFNVKCHRIQCESIFCSPLLYPGSYRQAEL